MPLVSNVPPASVIVKLSGPLIIGYLADWALFATLTVQLYLYYQAFPNDRPFIKCLVYGLYLLELVHTILETIDSFNAFGYGFASVSALSKISAEWFWAGILTILVSLIVQSFYAFRLYMLSRSRIIPVSILVVSLAVGVSGFITARWAREVGDVTHLNIRRISIAAGVWLGGSALVDISIAALMTYYLVITDTGFRRTHALVAKLIRLTVETGSLTALGAFLTLILFVALPGRGYYTTALHIMPLLYSNTMFAVLNSRFQIVGGRATDPCSSDLMSIPPQSLLFTGTKIGAATQPGPAPVVSITTEQVFSKGIGSEAAMEMKVVHYSGEDA